MFFHLLFSAIQRRKLRIALAVLAVVMGASIASTLFTVSFDINDKMGKELKSYGANILLMPSSEGEFIQESELYKMKTIFWRHNIVGYSPYLSDTVKIKDEEIVLSGTYFDEEIWLPELKKTFIGNRKAEESATGFRTGVKKIAPWWNIEGEWPEPGEALAGISAAEKMGIKKGDIFRAEYGDNNATYKVSGILSTGGDEDDRVIVSLGEAQGLFERQGMVDRVVVSALTKPEPRENIDPSLLPPEEYEVWYCTPYISSIMFQIEEAIPDASAKPIRQVADNEGKLLKKFELLMFLITGIAMISASLGVSAAMTTSIFERRKEIGLMKAIGADSVQISQLFFAEAVVIGIIGGAIGILIGFVLSRMVGLWVFGASISPSLMPALISEALAIVFALLGSLLPVKRAAEVEPSIILRSD
ncbi:ABC-type transport system, involved in lipoprotein release, permease component [Candidatus Methanoperedens nitroreducens]|uniref:ABC-type transport system, involved in lipoprotein release, permease component n=1 Tax=Candidatus Methanoperedens nitratireducens TaxID=1392998 RepID=A0A062VCK4_9EURY|nr:ABC transporter permease [Candidatus Methanoperedens nitroreducens]KCZ73399.1 ABC-type transport system, involved in lipoprotein release, permease component [Candidatus Methanoperedens nitroreducens]MDJ1422646.1 ABC transporter permease [Candidatus Methanoperedens sp.]